jgi:hypothetical protein
VGAGDVGADLLEVGHDAVHVRLGERRAAAGHVLVDRRPGQLDAPVVDVEHAALDGDRPQAHVAALDLLDLAAVAQHQLRRVQLGVLRLPQHGGRHAHGHPHPPALGALLRQPEGATGQAARGRAQPHLQRRRQLGHTAALEHCVDEQLRAAARRRAAAPHPGHRPQVVEVRGPGRDQPHRPHDPAPVPPALWQARVLAAVDDHDQLVRAPGPQPARLEGEGRVGVDVAAQPAPVEEHGGAAPDALELDQPAKAARRARAGEAQPVAAHLAGVLRGHGLRVEHARDRDRAPGRRLLGRLTARRRLGARGRHSLRLPLQRGGGLGRRGRRVLGAHLPALGQGLGARRRRRGGSGEHDRQRGNVCESPPHAPSR